MDRDGYCNLRGVDSAWSRFPIGSGTRADCIGMRDVPWDLGPHPFCSYLQKWGKEKRGCLGTGNPVEKIGFRTCFSHRICFFSGHPGVSLGNPTLDGLHLQVWKNRMEDDSFHLNNYHVILLYPIYLFGYPFSSRCPWILIFMKMFRNL